MTDHLIRTLTTAGILAVGLTAQRGGDRWGFLRKTYDGDGDGKVTKQEYPRSERGFANLDRNGDGVISAEDFARRGGRRRGRARPDVRQKLARFVDLYGTFLNRDGKPGIDRAEWGRIAALAGDDGGPITAQAFSKLLGKDGQGRMARMAGGAFRMLDLDDDGEVTAGDLDAAFRALDENGDGNLSQGDEVDLPPGIGEAAPDFALAHANDATKIVALSSFKGDRPVALIFGSYT